MLARLGLAYGWILIILCLAQLLPLIFAMSEGPEAVSVFLYPMAGCLAAAGFLLVAFRDLSPASGLRSAFIMPLLVFVGGGVAASLPFLLSGALGPADAVFEAVSALTTTAATLLPSTAEMPASLLLWQSILAWIGGIATVVLTLTFLKPMRVGGLGLVKNTFPSGEGRGFFTLLRSMSVKVALIYAVLGVMAVTLLLIAGLTPFDALRSGLALLATADYGPVEQPGWTAGGYLAATACMLAGSVNAALYWPLLSGRVHRSIRDVELRTFLFLILASWLLLTGLLLEGVENLAAALWRGLLLTVSFASTTGLDAHAYAGAGRVEIVLVAAALCLVGGCAASSTGGVKVLRLHLLFSQADRELDRLAYPHRTLPGRYGGVRVTDHDLAGFWLALIAFLIAFSIGSLVIALDGASPQSAMALAVAGLANVASLAEIADKNFFGYAGLSEGQKFVFALLSVIGRADAAFVAALILRSFWRL